MLPRRQPPFCTAPLPPFPQDPIDTLVDDQFSFDAKDKRVTFLAGDDVWSLKFGSAGGFERFLQKYNKVRPATASAAHALLERRAAHKACHPGTLGPA